MNPVKKYSKSIVAWIIFLIILLITLRMTLLAPYRVTAVELTPHNLQEEAVGVGTVEAKVVVRVGSKITGRITALNTDQGYKVKKGELLATLENDDFKNLTKQAERELEKANADIVANQAAIRQAEANFKLARNNYERYRKLLQDKVISQLDFDQKENENKVAEESVKMLNAQKTALIKQQKRAEANIGFAMARLADANIYSPCDGIVISREAEAGDAITAGASIFRIADISVIWILAYIDETMAGEIEVGNPARVYLRSRSQESLPGKVARVEMESDRVTEERVVDITFPVPSDAPPIGEQAEVYVVTGKKAQVPALPNSSLVPSGKKHGVWIIKDGCVHWRDVHIGIKDPSGWVEIVSGLEKGEQVANASPSIITKLKEGSRVSIHKEKL